LPDGLPDSFLVPTDLVNLREVLYECLVGTVPYNPMVKNPSGSIVSLDLDFPKL
jgi:hypothetical protein